MRKRFGAAAPGERIKITCSGDEGESRTKLDQVTVDEVPRMLERINALV